MKTETLAEILAKARAQEIKERRRERLSQSAKAIAAQAVRTAWIERSSYDTSLDSLFPPSFKLELRWSLVMDCIEAGNADLAGRLARGLYRMALDYRIACEAQANAHAVVKPCNRHELNGRANMGEQYLKLVAYIIQANEDCDARLGEHRATSTVKQSEAYFTDGEFNVN